jgi:hypothetical protein
VIRGQVGQLVHLLDRGGGRLQPDRPAGGGRRRLLHDVEDAVAVEEHGDHDVGVPDGVGGGVRDGRADLLGLVPAAVPDPDVQAGLDEVAGHRGAHDPGAQHAHGKCVSHTPILPRRPPRPLRA